MFPEILAWLWGFLVGLGSFSGFFSQTLGIPQIWIFDSELPIWYYYLNLPFTGAILGFATLGMYSIWKSTIIQPKKLHWP
jgi:hypothetical protein